MLDAGAAATARAGSPWVRHTSSISITPRGRTASPHTSRTYLLAKTLEMMVADERIGANEIAAYVAIQCHADATGHCRPAQGTLAAKLGRSRPWMNACVKRLIECDYLETTHRFHGKGGQTSNLYYLPHLDTNALTIETTAKPSPSQSDDSACPDGDTPCQPTDTNLIPFELEEDLSLSLRRRAGFLKSFARGLGQK